MSPSSLISPEESERIKRHNRRVIGGLVVAMLLGILAIPFVWHHQTKVRWEQAKADWERDIGTLDFKKLLPATVPEEDNFFAIPELAGLALESSGSSRLIDNLDDMELALPGGLNAHVAGSALSPEEFQEWYDTLVITEALNGLVAETKEPANALLSAIDALHPDVQRILEGAELKKRAQVTPSPRDRTWNQCLMRQEHHWALPCIRLAKLLYCRGLAALHIGSTNEAAASALAILHLVNAARDEPLLLNMLIASTLERIASLLIWHGLAMDKWESPHKSRFLEVVARFERHRALAYTLQTEAAALVSTSFDEAFELGEEARALGVSKSLSLDQKLLGSVGATYAEGFTNQLFLLRLFATLPDHDGGAAQDTLQKAAVFLAELRATGLRRWLNHSFGESAASTSVGVENALRQSAMRRQVRLGLALASFAKDKGSFPDSLTELVPQYVEKIPTDPIDGLSMRYLKLADGYQLWSVGMDGKDNAGDEEIDWLWKIRVLQEAELEKPRVRVLIPTE